MKNVLIVLIVKDDDGMEIRREWSPRNKGEHERRKEFIGRMLNEIEQEIDHISKSKQ